MWRDFYIRPKADFFRKKIEPMSEYTAQAQEIVNQVDSAWRTMIEKEEARTPASPRDYVYASSWHPCLRYMYYDCTRPDAKPEFDVDTLARMRMGKDRERDIVNIQLTRAGQYADPQFTVESNQARVTISDSSGRKIISGKKEGDIVWRNGSEVRVPFELKNWDERATWNIQSFDEIIHHRFQWFRSGGMQFLSYLYGSGAPVGIFTLGRRGLPKNLPVVFYDYMDELQMFLTAAEEVRNHIDAGIEPDFIKNPAVCKRCQFYGHTCNPPLNYEGVQLLTDERLIEDITRLKELEGKLADEEWTEYNRLDKKIKERLRGIESGVAGEWAVSGKWGKYTRYEIPADIKEQFKVVDPKGSFRIKIEKI